MAEMTSLTIRIDEKLKERAEALFTGRGLNLAMAVEIFIRQSLEEGKIPFEICEAADPFYSESNMRALRESLQQLREGKVVHKTLDELLAMERELEATETELAAMACGRE